MRLNRNSRKIGRILGLLAIPLLAAGTLPAQEGPTVSGFVDTTYNYNLNKPVGNANGLRVFDTQHNTFALQNAEIVVQGEMERAGYRVDVNWGRDAAATQSAGFDNAADANTTYVDVQQAYVTIPCPALEKGKLTAGKWVTLLGREVIEAGDNLNISRSFLFGFSIPFTHTGVKYDYAFSDKFNVTGGVVNGWDNLADNNNGKSFIGGFGFDPTDKLSFYWAGIYGSEQPTAVSPAPSTSQNSRGATTLLANYQVTDKLALMANGVYGSEEGVSAVNAGDEAVWTGGSVYLSYSFTDAVSAVVRYENFDDSDGARLGTAANSKGVVGGQIVNEYTLTLQCKSDNLIKRLEFRQDASNRLPFVDDKGKAEDSQATVAVQFIYTF